MSGDHIEHVTTQVCAEIVRLAEGIPALARSWRELSAWPSRVGEPTRTIGRSGTPGDPTARTAAWITQQREADLENLKRVRKVLWVMTRKLEPPEVNQPEVRHCACGNLAPNRRHPETRHPECENCYGRRRRAAKAER